MTDLIRKCPAAATHPIDPRLLQGLYQPCSDVPEAMRALLERLATLEVRRPDQAVTGAAR